MRALQFTAGTGVSYNRQFRGKNLTKTHFLRLMKEILFGVEPLIE
jgi:hypothetical protein